MKKFKVILITILVIIVSGCSKTRSSLTPAEFVNILEEYDYTVVDKTDTLDYANAAYLVNSKAFEFAYVNGKRKYDIEGLFVEECKNVMNIIGKQEYEKDLDSGDNFAYLKVTTEEKFYYVSWIDETYIYIKAPIGRQKELEALLDKLGY